MLVFSVASMVAAAVLRKRLAERLGGWNAALIAAGSYLVGSDRGGVHLARDQRGAGRIPSRGSMAIPGCVVWNATDHVGDDRFAIRRSDRTGCDIEGSTSRWKSCAGYVALEIQSEGGAFAKPRLERRKLVPGRTAEASLRRQRSGYGHQPEPPRARRSSDGTDVARPAIVTRIAPISSTIRSNFVSKRSKRFSISATRESQDIAKSAAATRF
jgi:hypothetical protein